MTVVAILHEAGTAGRGYGSQCFLCYLYRVTNEDAPIIECDALCNCAPEDGGGHLWSCPALGGYVCGRCENRIRTDLGEVDDVLRHRLMVLRAEVVRTQALMTVSEFEVTFERQGEPEGVSAPLVARDILADGECSAACLLAFGPGDCQCRCGGLYHGALLDEKVSGRRAMARC